MLGNALLARPPAQREGFSEGYSHFEGYSHLHIYTYIYIYIYIYTYIARHASLAGERETHVSVKPCIPPDLTSSRVPTRIRIQFELSGQNSDQGL